MSAVLRVWWTFFTAVPLQRWLAVVGAAVAGLLLVTVSVAVQRPPPAAGYAIAAAAFTMFAVVPPLFAGGPFLRMLSAPRSHQLLPYFRVRMLVATALLVASQVLWFAAVMVGPVLAAGRDPWASLLILPFAFVTGVFLWLFLASGDVRWWVAGVLLVALPSRIFPSAGGSAWLAPIAGALAALAWLVFAIWYLRVRRVPPLQLAARPWRWPSAIARPLGQAEAIRALVAGYFEWSLPRQLLGAVGAGVAFSVLLGLVFVWPGRFERLPYFTNFPWPFVVMVMMGVIGARSAYRSRALWLQIPGRRADIYARIERLVARRWLLAVVAMLPIALGAWLFGASSAELALALLLCASAGLYGGWLSLAAVPGVKTHLLGFGLMTLAQLGLLARVEPVFPSVGIVIGAQLLGAALFRALAVRRWRRIDWLSFRPPAIMTRGIGWTH